MLLDVYSYRVLLMEDRLVLSENISFVLPSSLVVHINYVYGKDLVTQLYTIFLSVFSRSSALRGSRS